MFLEPFEIFVPLCVLVLWQLVRFLCSVNCKIPKAAQKSDV